MGGAVGSRKVFGQPRASRPQGPIESPSAEVVSKAEQMAESPGDVRLRDYEDMHKRGLFIGLLSSVQSLSRIRLFANP